MPKPFSMSLPPEKRMDVQGPSCLRSWAARPRPWSIWLHPPRRAKIPDQAHSMSQSQRYGPKLKKTPLRWEKRLPRSDRIDSESSPYLQFLETPYVMNFWLILSSSEFSVNPKGVYIIYYKFGLSPNQLFKILLKIRPAPGRKGSLRRKHRRDIPFPDSLAPFQSGAGAGKERFEETIAPPATSNERKSPHDCKQDDFSFGPLESLYILIYRFTYPQLIWRWSNFIFYLKSRERSWRYPLEKLWNG